MTDERQLSGRNDGVTSASSHPELLCGYLAIRPSGRVTLAAPDQTTMTIGSRCIVGVLAILAAAVVLLPIFKTHSDPSIQAQAALAGTAHVCARWDERASEAIAHLLEHGKGDVGERQIGDAMTRVRRARRSCQLNWIALACQDYHAIIHGVAGTSSSWPTSPGVCGLALEDRSASR
jgi:hypothetical protein